MVYNGTTKTDAIAEMNAFFGGILFIGISSSLQGTVLIYYKQISQKVEDRERFVILQKVGLDQKQQTNH